MDGFHLPQARLMQLGRRERMGAPDTFDVDGFVRVLGEIRTSGRDVVAPGFDRTVEESVPGGIRVPRDASIVVTEGNYLLLATGGWERVRPLMDLALTIEVEQGARMSRLVARHELFGKSPEAAVAWASGPDQANADLVAGAAGRADHVVALG